MMKNSGESQHHDLLSAQADTTFSFGDHFNSLIPTYFHCDVQGTLGSKQGIH